MSYSEIVATIALIISISAVPASGYLSYRYAVMGEKRKEFNLLAEPMLVGLEKVKKSWSVKQKPSFDPIPYSSIEQLHRRMPPRKQDDYSAAWARYHKCRDSMRTPGTDHQSLFSDGVQAIDRLLVFHALK